ncbi:MAG: hypothetical protein OXI29_06155, partial [bacterium]|nr:hypothetical protein [bacterium]
STARILAKALNCTDLSSEGEPCGQCQSCLDIANNASYDLIELDAASNNKVDDVRDLISRVAIGSPGKAKVYVLDEVHMLTPGAENALLKTLEEPPDHVVFVLCTTEPHKVVPTIRSRTQHLEFSLIDGDVLADHARWVVQQAGLEVGDDAIDHAVHRGAGSARDTLSALDQIAAAGGVADRLDAVDAVIDALGGQDYGPAFVAVHDALRSGREPRIIGEAVLDRLRNAFLCAMGADLSHLTDSQQESARATAALIPPAGLTRALEVLGTALVDMRQAPDPRVDLEVALGRLTRRDLDTDIGALLERVERLERQGPPSSAGISERDNPAPSVEASSPARRSPGPTSGHERARAAIAQIQAKQTEAEASSTAPPAQESESEAAQSPDRSPRPTLGAVRAGTAPAVQPAGPEPSVAASISETGAGPAEASEPLPSREEIVLAWGDTILGNLSNKAKVRFKDGRFLANDPDGAVYALPSQIQIDRCDEVRGEVDSALRQHFGRTVPLRLVVDDDSTAPPPNLSPASERSALTVHDEAEAIDPNELMDEEAVAQEAISNIMAAFPDSELVSIEPPAAAGQQSSGQQGSGQ